MVDVVLLSNVPAPYRVPTFRRLSRCRDNQFTAIFCAERYPGSAWDYGTLDFSHIFLKERFFRKPGEIVHHNPDVFHHLKALNPDVVITSGFNPTALYAFLYTRLYKKRHIPLSDGTAVSESSLSFLHRIVRRVVFRASCSFIGASDKTIALYESYGIARDRCFKSALCIDNDRFGRTRSISKKYDLMFCGRFIDTKKPLFVVEVANELRKKIGREVSMLFVGAGPQELAVRECLQRYRLEQCTFSGFASQDELPALYGAARVFVFPSVNDTWGVVVNEACAAGLPIIVSPYPGVVGELVKNGENGYVCEFNAKLWADHIQRLLRNRDLYQRFSARSIELVANYNFDAAAQGIISAIKYACET